MLSDTPLSRNASAGTLVEFTCATPETGLNTFVISTTPPVGDSVITDVILPNGDRQVTLNFIAPSDYTNVTITCAAVRGSNVSLSTAFLLVQGNSL